MENQSAAPTPSAGAKQVGRTSVWQEDPDTTTALATGPSDTDLNSKIAGTSDTDTSGKYF